MVGCVPCVGIMIPHAAAIASATMMSIGFWLLPMRTKESMMMQMR